MVLSLSFTVISCGDEDKDPPTSAGGGAGTSGDGTETGGDGTETGGGSGSDGAQDGATSASNKKKLNDAAKAFMAEIDASAFDRIRDLADYMSETVYDSNSDEVDDWFEACLEVCENKFSDSHVMNVFAASSFTGKFALRSNSWVKTVDADYLEFTFRDESDRTCVLTAKHSGKETLVHHDSFDTDDYDEGYDEYGNWHSGTVFYENKFRIPENIHITLTQGGATLADVKVITKLDMRGEEFNLQTDAATVTTVLSVGGYTFNVQRVAFKANSDAALSASFSRGSKTLLTLNASVANPSYDEYDDDVEAGAVVFSTDLMGLVQIKGNISDASDCASYLERLDENKHNEDRYRDCLTLVNGCIDAKLYLDNSDKYSAYVELQRTERKENNWYYGYTERYWSCEPILIFPDGTGVSFNKYFDENSFANVIDRFERLLDDFARLFE